MGRYKEAIDILHHPWLHPFKSRDAIAMARGLMFEIDVGSRVSFSMPVKPGRVAFFIHGGRILERTIKSYRVREGGVYVDIYSPPEGVIFGLQDVFCNPAAAQAALDRRGLGLKPSIVIYDEMASLAKANPALLKEKADRVAAHITKTIMASLEDLGSGGYVMVAPSEDALARGLYTDEAHEIFRDSDLMTAVVEILKNDGRFTVSLRPGEIAFLRKKGGAVHE